MSYRNGGPALGQTGRSSAGSKFQQRHYNALAEVIRERVRRSHTFDGSTGPARRAHLREISHDLASLFAGDNVNFKADVWHKATGLENET